jgi:hypothetical protein
VTTIPLITTIPSDPPSTDDPANFDTRGDSFLGDFPPFGAQINATATAMNAVAGEVNAAASDIAAAALVASNAAGLLGASITSVDASPGAKAITLTAAKPSLVEINRRVALVLKSDPTVKRFGTITSVTDSSHFELTITSGGIFGAGTFSNWHVLDAAFLGSAATAAEIWEGATDAAAVSPKALKDAQAFATLTDASTIAWNVATQGFNARVTLTASGHTMGAPSGLYDGLTIALEIVQDPTGSRTMSWNSIWDFGNAGLPLLQTAANKADRVFGQYNARTGKIDASFRKGA